MSLGKGPPLDRCCIGSALSTGRRFKREPSRSIVKCDPGADFPWNSEAPSFERGRQPIPQSCPTERQWNNFSLSPASLPESCPTERLWDSFCAAASPAAPAEAGRSHPQQGSYRFRRDARGTMIAPQQIAPRDAHPSIVVPAPKSPSHNPVRTLRYHASHASQGSPLGRKLSATLFVADGLTRNIAVGSFEPSFRLSLAGRFRPQQGDVVHSLECTVSVRNRPWSQREIRFPAGVVGEASPALAISGVARAAMAERSSRARAMGSCREAHRVDRAAHQPGVQEPHHRIRAPRGA
jgi:hypothetical protein